MAWINNDGLAVRIGKEEATEGNRGGVATVSGPWHITEFKVNATELTTTSSLINESMLTIPRGMRVEKVEILVETAFTSGGSATLNIGEANLNRTALAATGFVAALAVASLTAGALISITTGSTGAGSLVGGVTTAPGVVVANAGTAVFTAGKATVRIYGYMP